MLRKLLLIAITSGLAARLYRHCAGSHSHDLQTDPQALHTWEHEGGALHPASAAHDGT